MAVNTYTGGNAVALISKPPSPIGAVDGTLDLFTGTITGTQESQPIEGLIGGTLDLFAGAFTGEADRRAVFLNTSQTLTGAVRQTLVTWTEAQVDWDVVQGALPSDTDLEHALVLRNGTVLWSPYTVQILTPLNLNVVMRGFGA